MVFLYWDGWGMRVTVQVLIPGNQCRFPYTYCWREVGGKLEGGRKAVGREG